MSSDHTDPDEPAGPFPTPPCAFEDRVGRDIEIRVYDGSDDEYEALVEMYRGFDSKDRAQGIPPGREERIRNWLDNILSSDCLNVIAWDGLAVAGHATLVPDEDSYELAIFVLQVYQQAGIGTHLIEALLGHGIDSDITQVWLTVERWNNAAIALYKKVGFETSDSESFELKMGIDLDNSETY
ncbi:MAG: acetyltransferase [Haloquadratum walsbyi J07HQW1]|jgi:ribosomal protein S18 acetylase RimI-like enzyme|uniref:Acetyltransferase n=1 Tax=Haloquadratum walsbyi J07HQW1 TaxID=1238424 RepID=U1N168_9EURY|nr:MAG: acetyltransferase [Haloquadratum walsbyi J07HQW1]